MLFKFHLDGDMVLRQKFELFVRWFTPLVQESQHTLYQTVVDEEEEVSGYTISDIVEFVSKP